jgi:quercetin dioxygenase-like cupin family protein
MAAVNRPQTSSYAFDDSRIQWHPFAGIEHLEFSLCDLDEERQVVDLIVKFEPDKIVAIHNHIAQTNMLVIQGELRMYETDGTLKEIRPAGKYIRGRRDDVHSEGGGPEGAVVFYSVRGHGSDNMLEIMDDASKVIATITMADLRAVWAAQSAQK